MPSIEYEHNNRQRVASAIAAAMHYSDDERQKAIAGAILSCAAEAQLLLELRAALNDLKLVNMGTRDEARRDGIARLEEFCLAREDAICNVFESRIGVFLKCPKIEDPFTAAGVSGML